MVNLPLYLVDVFADRKYAGNQLAVVADAGDLSDSEMQAIAREINFSETSFILHRQPRNGGYDVRIFSPQKELPFAGHPTLGTAFIIQKEFLKDSEKSIVLNLKVGQIRVNPQESTLLWMQQNSPVFGQRLEGATLGEVLNIDIEQIDLRFPIQEVSTGIPFTIVPLKTHEALKGVRVNREKYFEWAKSAQAPEILIFCPGTYSPDNDLSVRVFAECLGIPEDPATGSANGCLAAYLLEYDYFEGKSIDIRVEQGYEIGRPSLLFLKAQRKDGKIEVFVGGKVLMVAKGELV
ncbi:MAG: PhzF family phenazine biosynthesis protein [Cyanobacteriota bacterium]|nr:PhzF family phenazine biosynthesis protein [Cyanobacteriota bacterium]